MKKKKLRWIFGNYSITQKFGKTYFANENPSYYPVGGHTGIDFGMPVRTPVKAATDGEVRQDDDAGNGARGISLCIIDPKQLISTHYLHLSFNIVTDGQKVKAGDIIGYSGNTGLSTAPHLHFGLCEVDKNWMRINKNNGTNGFIDPFDEERFQWIA